MTTACPRRLIMHHPCACCRRGHPNVRCIKAPAFLLSNSPTGLLAA